MIRNKITKAVTVVLVAVFSCDSYEQYEAPSDLTGNSVTYPLQSGSYWNVSGAITLNEKTNGSTRIEIKLEGIPDSDSNKGLPVHLHFGDISTDKAEIAGHLQSVYMKSGLSKTDLSVLANQTPVTYEDLKKLNACVKIHLSEYGEGRDIVLAAGNVGSAVTATNPGGRAKIGVCKSE